MRSAIDRRLACIIALAVAAFLAPEALPAQELAAEKQELPPAPILVNLDLATVRILIASDRAPELRWRKLRTEDPGPAELRATTDASGIVIARPEAQAEGLPARLNVEVTVHPADQVVVVGRDLDLTIERVLTEADVEDPDAPVEEQRPNPMALINLQLESSQVSLTLTGPLTASVENCDVETLQTKGYFDLTVIDSGLRLEHHRGNLEIESLGSDTTMVDHRGKVTGRIDGGSIGLEGAYGNLDINAISAQVAVGDWKGTGLIALNQATADIRDSKIQTLNLKSTASQVGLSRSKSKTTADFTGGSLTMDEVIGDGTFTARNGARFNFTNQNGKIKLNLGEDTFADLRGMRGNVDATARGADVSIEDADNVALKASNSWINLSTISKLGAFEVTRCETELDLTASNGKRFVVTAKADSSLRVQLRTPCRVDATGTSATSKSQVDVIGCELKLAQGGKWSSKRVRSVEGKLPVTLVANISERTSLTVEGRP